MTEDQGKRAVKERLQLILSRETRLRNSFKDITADGNLETLLVTDSCQTLTALVWGRLARVALASIKEMSLAEIKAMAGKELAVKTMGLAGGQGNNIMEEVKLRAELAFWGDLVLECG